MHYFYAVLLLLAFAGCEKDTTKVHYDGGMLLQEKCAKCHNLKMPPDTYENEKAPPMMAVVFHLKDFMKIKNDQEKTEKFISFIQNYVINPSREKSYCDKESLKTYGIMPSQKGNVSIDELTAIAQYIYGFYDQQRFLKEIQEKSAFDALPKGEQIVRRNGCMNCHNAQKAKVGPSFMQMAKRDKKEIREVIENGSQGKWKDFHNMMMPPFASRISDGDIRKIQEWISNMDTAKKEKTWKMKNDI